MDLVRVFLYTNTLCMQEEKDLTRLYVCTGSSDHSLLADAIHTKTSCAGLLVASIKFKPEYIVENICQY